MYNVKSFGSTSKELVFNEATAPVNGALSVDAIKSWLVSELSELLSVNARDLAVDEPLINYGLSSMTAMMFSGNIEEWLDIRLEPSVAWEYPTIELLAGYLADEVKRQQPAPAST